MKKLCALALCLALCVGLLPSAAWAAGPEIKAKAVLLMEKSTGEILYEEHGEEPLELASVTKVMTMLLIMEALEDGTLTPDTMVAVSANAAGMGGSQVYMKEGETFSVHDMLKAIAVASGNDACVAMAEHLAGSEAAFVERMNARAAELGMENTVFCNCTGLPAEGHHSTANDIALMSRELIRKHPDIRTYTTIWMDTLRDGSFQLANTNKLIRFYDGATGLKTGSTDGALYCISATPAEGSAPAVPPKAENTLNYSVCKGLKEAAATQAKELAEGGREILDIINGELVPALDEVGKAFEKGKLFLPQLLMSAEAAKEAFQVLKEYLPATESHGAPQIVLATVKGDIHDIGKNIVKVLLESYRFRVLDLGKDVPPEAIVEAVRAQKIPLVGLSALMTTTAPYMKETIQALHEAGLDCKVVVGGAVITQDYADEIKADHYAADAMETVHYAQEVLGG